MRTMKVAVMLLGTAAVIGSAVSSYAADKADLGKREYTMNCAVCHGTTGKGDGPYAGLVDTRIADVTTLSKRNNGVFPFAKVYDVIDGAQVVKAHGTRDMPIWGTDYKIKAAEYYRDVDYDDEAYVRARILSLTEYIYRLQGK